MSWFSIDAVDGAIKRTTKVLIEPFDFWKWIKLGLISILIGSAGGGSNFFTNSSNLSEKTGKKMPPIDEILSQLNQFWNQYITLILIAVIFIIFIILVFSFISSVMEFVLVESLVTNNVAFWAYSRKYLRKGFNLFIIRLLLGLLFLSIFIIAVLPAIIPILESLHNISFGMIIGAFIWSIAVLLIIAIINGIIQSFINLSIPLAMYNDTGIIAAFKAISEKFRADWKQIIVYWVVRLILGLVAGIIVGLAAVILGIVLLIILAIPGIILYFLVPGLFHIANVLFWIVMIPYALIVLTIFVLFILFAAAPGSVFMKYHMLTFLQLWYKDAKIPFFTMPNNIQTG